MSPLTRKCGPLLAAAGCLILACGGCQRPALVIAPTGPETAQPTPALADEAAPTPPLLDPTLPAADASGDNGVADLQEALATALRTQEILTAQLRKTNETVRGLRDDVILLRERLRDLELAQDRRPASRPPADPSVALRP